MNQKAVHLIRAGTEKFNIPPPFTEREGQILKAFYCVAVECYRLADKCQALERELSELKPGSVNE